MTDRRYGEDIPARDDLDRTRQDLADAISALGEKLSPGRFFQRGRARTDEGAEQGGLLRAVLPGGASAFVPALTVAGNAMRANPLATALAGAGLAWLAWGGLRRASAAPREARPEWLVEAGALREEADRLRAKVARALAGNMLDPSEAQESLDEIEAALEAETRRLMGRGLDGLEAEARAAALSARETAWSREFGKAGAGKSSDLPRAAGKALTSAALLATLGGAAAAFFARQSPAEIAQREAEAAASEAADAARRILADEADRLTGLVADLSRALRDIALGIGEEVSESEDTGGADPASEDPVGKERSRSV